jgi:uncharacterized protein (TIGR02118 family)
MARVIAIYGKPTDAAAFDRYYHATHVPIAKRLPGLRSYEVSHGPVRGLEGPAPCHLIAILTFDSVAAIEAAIASDAGKATAADLANFASGGVTLYIVDTETI